MKFSYKEICIPRIFIIPRCTRRTPRLKPFQSIYRWIKYLHLIFTALHHAHDHLAEGPSSSEFWTSKSDQQTNKNMISRLVYGTVTYYQSDSHFSCGKALLAGSSDFLTGFIQFASALIQIFLIGFIQFLYNCVKHAPHILAELCKYQRSVSRKTIPY